MIFIAGPVLYTFPEIMEFVDVGLWLHLLDADTLGKRRWVRHTGKDPRMGKISERLGIFLQAHRNVDQKAYTRSLALQFDIATKIGAIQVDAHPSAEEVLEQTCSKLDPVLLASSLKWRSKPIPDDKREEAKRVRAEVESQHAKKKKEDEPHEPSVTATGPEDDAHSSSAKDAVSVTATGPNDADDETGEDFCKSVTSDSETERSRAPTPDPLDPLGLFAALPRDGRKAPIVRRGNLTLVEADAAGIGMHANRRARRFRKGRPALPARWVVKKRRLDPVAEEDEENQE